jgi:hypothetical protein
MKIHRNVVHGHVPDNLMKHVVVIFVIQFTLLMALHEKVFVSILKNDQ